MGCRLQKELHKQARDDLYKSWEISSDLPTFLLPLCPCLSSPILTPVCLSNVPELGGPSQPSGHSTPGKQSYLLFDFLELPALLSDVMEKLQCFVILLGHLHPCLLQTSL